MIHSERILICRNCAHASIFLHTRLAAVCQGARATHLYIRSLSCLVIGGKKSNRTNRTLPQLPHTPTTQLECVPGPQFINLVAFKKKTTLEHVVAHRLPPGHAVAGASRPDSDTRSNAGRRASVCLRADNNKRHEEQLGVSHGSGTLARGVRGRSGPLHC